MSKFRGRPSLTAPHASESFELKIQSRGGFHGHGPHAADQKGLKGRSRGENLPKFLKILEKSILPVLAQIWHFWPSGPSRLDSHNFFESIALVYVEKSYMVTQNVIFFIFHTGFDFSTNYQKRFLVKKRLRNNQPQLKTGANDSEWTCATFLKKSDSGKIFKFIVFCKYFCQNRVWVIFQKSILSAFYEENHSLEFWPRGGGPLFGA